MLGADSNLNYFRTSCDMNVRLYLLEIIFGEKKFEKNIRFSGDNIFLYRGYCQKIGRRICFRNSFSGRNKHVDV